MRDPTKGHAALRRGRVSILHAEYFLTVCTDEKRPSLASPAAATAILAELRAMDTDGTWQLRCAVVLPDHVHVLAILGDRLTLGQSVGRLKSKTKSSLSAVAANSAASLDWERDFYDHHVRPDEDRLALFLYIFLNPYRAGLCATGDAWPWYYCRDDDWSWFSDLLAENRPYPEWLL
jgi:REP element-mobilizing transposase RayT